MPLQHDEVNNLKGNSLGNYVADFLFYLQKETGFSIQAFTRAGLTQRLKVISKSFFHLEILDGVLRKVIYIAKTLSDATKEPLQKLEASLVSLVEILEQLTKFLFNSFLGKGVLIVTATMNSLMTGFIISLYFFLTYLYDKFSCDWFIKLKEYIRFHVNSEKFLKFFGYLESTKYAIQ